jgi:cytoskeletal protein CcmA (bactofilin family)
MLRDRKAARGAAAEARSAQVGLLNKIFGNRDDPETAAGAGSDESAPERETIELEPYEPSAGDEPTAAPEQSGRVTFAPPAGDASASATAGRTRAGGRRKRRRAPEAELGSDEQPHELTRRRIARPTASTEETPIPPPIPIEPPEADDPEEIDVSDQLDDVIDAEADLDASSDLIIEDDEPAGEDEDDDETSTSVALWRDPAPGPAPASNPRATTDVATGPAPLAAAAPQPTGAPLEAAALERWPHDETPHDETPHDASGSISADTTQPDPDWTRMATDTKAPKQTLVAAGTEFRGTLKSSCPVVVNGTLEGEIDAPSLSIASTGSIHGHIRVQTLRSSGTLAGSVDAGEVYVSGAVRSKTVIRARRMELALGSSGNGHVEVTVKSNEVEPRDAPSVPEASTARSVAPAGESDASGGAAWDLPDGDDGAEPDRAHASGERTTAK